MKKQPLWTKDFLGVSITSFFLFIGFYILLTTLPIYILDDLKGSESQVGLIISVFLIAAVISRPFTGKWIDEIGRKKILMISMVIFTVASALYFTADSLPMLLAVRFLHGAGFGMATTATGAIVADIVPAERRGEGLGYYAMFMNLAMVIGPFTGLTIIQYAAYSWIFVLCTVLAVLALVLSSIISIPENSGEKTKQPSFAFSSLFEKNAVPVSIAAGTLAFAYSGVLSFISVYAKELGLMQAASFFFVVYAAFILISRPFTGRWFDMYGENRVIYPAIVLFAAGLFLLSLADNSFLFLLAGAVIGLGYGTIVPSMQTVAIKNADPSKRGLATSTFFTMFDSGIGLGSYVLGIVAVYTGFAKLYMVLVLVSLIGLGLYYILHGKKTAAAKEEMQSEVNISL
ncbi:MULTISPECIES: MFS transporter [Bacillus]|uniref:MFS transporter n=2 Tax=Bacillus infantis TaxID=324767 RepID=U5L7H5_9BACI|nr:MULTISPECIES: MFS transporter [Bacillus]AGX02686.1 MFS transporter [Bacillus infantis NRRL B-14911]EAR67296.1 quinolone resistence NorA protein, major facilitator family transporter [Bacillus sp. NRRL B-14911]MCP1156926.1 MFS transporter [Bacillus infantis]TYS62048.1 MFS transporter [Bacillus infantis]